MLLEEALRAYLMSKVEITDRIGSRLYPIVAPQTVTTPFVVYARTGLAAASLLREPGFTGVPMEIAIYGDDYNEIKQIAYLLRKPPVLGNYRGVWSGIPIQWVQCANEVDDYDDAAKGGTGLKLVRQSYEITVEEQYD